MKSSAERKRALLLESDLNRQVLLLESAMLQHRLRNLRQGVFQSRWTYLAPLAGLVVAWRFPSLRPLLRSSFGLLLLRKLWENISSSLSRPSQ